MNIKFKNIEINGFRSIDKINLELDNQGIVIVSGINEYEDNASSNGSGKSSIFEAIIYALFEETSSGDKSIENRILGNGFSIKLDFDIDKDNYMIFRQGKNDKSTVSLFKNEEDISARTRTDTNKLIVSLLGITKDIFLDSVFLSQNISTNLASLSPTARKERLEILTNTDYTVNLFKDKLKKRQVEYENLCVEDQLKINKYNGNIEALNSQKVDLQNKININEIKLQELKKLGNIEDIEKEIEIYNTSIETINKEINEIDNSVKSIESEIDKINNSNQENETAKKEIYDKITDLNTHKSELDISKTSINNNILTSNTNINRINKEIDEIKNSDTCPTCGRKYDNVNEEHITETINQKLKLIEEENKNITNYNEEFKSIQSQINNLEDTIKLEKINLNEIEEKIVLVKSQITEQESKRRELNNNKNKCIEDKNNYQNKINNCQALKEKILKFEINNTDEYKEMIKNIDKDIDKYDQEIINLQKKYDENNNLVNTVKHCLQLITKEFRTYLLQNSIKYLNNLLLNYSKSLFSNEKDYIYITNENSKLDIKLGNATYESLSGGEKTRVNIALLLAQKSLANTIGNISSNIIILDEILGYCDSKAESNVIDLISKELDSLESIYMISHKEIPVGYDKELVIIKDRTGLSHLRQY